MPELNLKIQTPEIPPFAIHRHDLVQTLRSNTHKRLIFIVAAGGWGKSTLLASYAQTIPCPHLWYNVDPSDQDPAVFSSILADGLYQIIPREKKSLVPPLTALNRSGSDCRPFFRHLFNTLLSDPSQRLVLFFDDYHLAGINPRFNIFFSKLFENFPLNLQLIISSREDPQLLGSQFTDNGDLIRLTANQLKFSADEIKLYFKQNYAVDLFRHDVTRIQRQTEGWPVGLRLTSEKLAVGQGRDSAASMIGQRINSDLVDQYFQAQLESGVPDDIRRFLIKAAIFQMISPQLCEAVLGWRGADAYLERMANTGLFVIRLDPDRPLYRFHHLFRTFLLDRIADEEQEDAVLKLHKNAAAYYFQQEQWREAASHYIMAKAYANAAAIIKEKIRYFISIGSAENLLQLLGKIPGDVVRGDAALLYARGWALFLIGRWNDARKTLHIAKQQALADREMPFYGQIAQLLMFLNVSVDDCNANQQLAEESLRYLPPESREAALINTQLATSLMHLGQPDASREVWQRIQDHPLIKEDIHLFMETVPLMAFNYHYFMGNFEAALNLSDKAINHFRSADYMGRLGRNLFFKGAIKFEMGDFSEAGQLLNEAQQESLKTGDRSLILLILSLSAVNAMALGDMEQVDEFIETAERLFSQAPEQTTWKEFMLYWAKAMTAYRVNQPEHFFSNAKKAMHTVERKNLWMDQYLIGCSFAIAYVKFGRPDLAASMMDKVLSKTAILKNSYPLARAHLLMAAVQHALGKNERTVDHLRSAVDIAKTKNYDFLFLKKETEVSRKLLPLALNHHIQIDFSAYLLVRLNNGSGLPLIPLLETDDPELTLETIRILSEYGCRDIENRLSQLTKDKDTRIRQRAESAVTRIQMLPPLALHVKTLGRFTISQGSCRVANTAWRRKLAKSIAKFLIVHADREFTSEQLMEIFLPNASLNEGRQLLNQAISVVRRAFEPGIAPKRESAYVKLQHGTYRFTLPEGSTVDLITFEQFCKVAAAAQSKQDHYSALVNYSKALELYKGNFLPEDLYQQWTAPIREQARSMYLRALYATANAYFQKLEFERCIHQAEHLLREEPWDEKAYLLLMQCHFALGDRPRLMKVFQACSAVLEKDLGILPSGELHRFYKQAIGNGLMVRPG